MFYYFVHVSTRQIKRQQRYKMFPLLHDVLVAVADVSGGGVGEVLAGVVEELGLELGLGLPQPPDLVTKLGELGVQGPLLRGQLHLAEENIMRKSELNIMRKNRI